MCSQTSFWVLHLRIECCRMSRFWCIEPKTVIYSFCFQISWENTNEWGIIQKSLCFHSSDIRCKWGIFLFTCNIDWHVVLLSITDHFSFQGTDQQVQGVLNLIDLAGSERLNKSGATGDRLKETLVICQSCSLALFVF